MGTRRYEPTTLEKARDELFSHIRRCGVLEAEVDQREEWLSETVDYLAERYPELGPPEQEELKAIGRRYCSPAIPHGRTTAREAHDEAPAGDTDGTRETESDEEPREVGAA
ncbi:MAG: hypothetical protein ACE5HP_12115 [Gemmatimonadota bacterium]